MDCPVCKEAMITMELAEVEIDHCLACAGIWLDGGELEMLLADAQQATAVLDSFRPAKTTEKARKCPICLKKMQKVSAGTQEHTILLDRCQGGDGLWFDKGELNDIAAFASFDEDHKIMRLLADMFGTKKAK